MPCPLRAICKETAQTERNLTPLYSFQDIYVFKINNINSPQIEDLTALFFFLHIVHPNFVTV